MIKAHGGSREATSSPDGARFHSPGRSPRCSTQVASDEPPRSRGLPRSGHSPGIHAGENGSTLLCIQPRSRGLPFAWLKPSWKPRERGWKKVKWGGFEPGVNAGPNTAARKPRERGKPALGRYKRCVEERGRSPGKANHSAPIHPNGVKPMSPFHAAAGRALSGLTKCLLQTQTLGCRITPRRGDAPRRWAALGKNPSRHQDRPHGKESR